MPDQELFTGPHLPTLESHAFQELSESVGNLPESVLYLTQQDHPQDVTRDRWQRVGPSACLRVETFDRLVTDCYERDEYKGRVTHIDRPLLFRLVELGVERIDTATNPISTGDRFPRAGFVQDVERLFTQLEFAGLLSADAMQRRLEQEGLDDRAKHIAELAASIETARQRVLADELPETYRTERMAHVMNSETALSDLLPAVDAVVVSGFTRFDRLERQFLERIVDEWPTVALLPLQTDTGTATGVDTATKRALETYREMGFTRRRVAETDRGEVEARQRLVRNLYRHPDRAPPTGDIDATSLDLTYARPETVPEEIRAVARDVRARIASGTSPENIGVILTNPTEYADQVREIFETYDLPFSLQTDVPLQETALGAAVETVCQLAREPRSVDTLLDLLTNPLVSVPQAEETEPIDHQELARVASRIETNGLDAALDHLDDPTVDAVESLIDDATRLATTSIDALPEQLGAVLDRLGISAALDGERDIADSIRAQESSASDRLDRIVETLALTEPVADPDLGDTVDRLERALAGVSIRQHEYPPEGRVVVCSLEETLPREFDRVYLLGATSTHVPSDPERLAFTRPIYDSHPDFEQPDAAAEARYHIGALLGSDATIRISAPKRSVSGDPYIEADVMTELRRLIDLSAITENEETDADATPSKPGSQEDVQRSIGHTLAHTSTETALELVHEAIQQGSLHEPQRARIEAGVRAAAARAKTDLTEYDGQLTPETVAQLHPESTREPYSPSRLETFAACGFKYYMRRVLEIDPPDPLTREPDAGVRGTYIHDVFEHYYRSLQSEAGDPVHPGQDFDARQAQLLSVALERLDEAFDEYPATGFHDEWLRSVLAGLGAPADNPYYGPRGETENGRPIARGLFYRFLEHEFDEPARTTARPAWFEARIGNPYDAGTSVSDEPAVVRTPAGPVQIHGLIDRVERVPGTSPEQVVVRDYKTGSSIPGEADALLGLNFQLPLYALMAEDALDDVETVGAAYYQTSPPTSVNSRSGLLTSQEMATYYDSDEVETPLLRYSYPHFETHDAFRRFVANTTADRLGQLATGIAAGRFHPTLLDPSDAGCRYCDYADVCDVRPHQRRETIDTIDTSDPSIYLPPAAHDVDPEEAVEVN